MVYCSFQFPLCDFHESRPHPSWDSQPSCFRGFDDQLPILLAPAAHLSSRIDFLDFFAWSSHAGILVSVWFPCKAENSEIIPEFNQSCIARNEVLVYNAIMTERQQQPLTKGETMKATTESLIRNLVDNLSAVMIGSDCVIGFLPAETKQYQRVTRGAEPTSGARPIGVIVCESRVRHPDSLSVSGGIWLRSTETMAVEEPQFVFVTTGDDGKPNYNRLLRDGGGLATLLRGLGI